MTLKVLLTPQIAQFIESLVQAGRYDSPDDAVNGALAALQSRPELPIEEVDELRAEVAVGIAEADHDEVGPWDPGDLKRRVREQVSKEKKAG